LADVKDSRFSQELEQFLACKKSSGDSFDLDLSEALGSLNGPSSRGDSFLSYQLGALQQTLGGFEKSQIEYLVNGWMRDFQFTGGATVDPQAEQSQMRGNLWVKGIRALPYWIVPEAPVFGSSGLTSDIREAPLKSLMHGLRPLVTQSDHLRDFESLQDLGARVLEKDLFPKLLSDAEVLFTRTQEIREQQSYPEYQERELANQKAALGKIYTPELREVLKYWVRSVECWRGSGLNVEKRVDEIIHESQNRVTTYELIDTPEGPKAPLAWNFNSLKNQAKPILDRLRDERLSNSEHLLLDSTFKFFQSATGAASSESGAFSPYKRGNFWVRYSPEKLLELFHKRARRVSPRIQYYKGHPNPYVVLDSDLDLMEKALGNVDMRLDAPPGKNIAFQFSEELAHAWGDLPAAEWPDEIAKKYSVAFHIAQSQGFTDPSAWGEASRKSYEHSRPRTLGEAVDGIINRPPNFGHSFDPVTIAFEIGVYKAGIPVPEFKKNFSQDHGLEDLKILTQEAAGLPALPQCVRDHQEFFFSPEFNTEMVRVVHLPPGLNRPGFHQPPFPRKSDGHVAIKGGLTVLKGPTEFANMQGMLFNLWQSIDVLKQNVPGAPENDDGGLLPVMRDLFFEVFYSNTKEVLDKEFPSTEIDKNQLRLVSQFLRLGVMHQLGMQLQKFELNDPALKAVFHSVLRGASSPEMLQLTRYLLHKDPEDRLIWNVVQGISNAKSSQVDELKRLSFYLLAGLDQIDPWAGPQRDSRDLGVAVQALARSHELMDSFYNWFVKIGAAHSGRDISSLIEKVVDSRWGSSSAEALYEMLNQATESSGTPERWRELILEALREAQPGATRSDLCATVSLAKATWEDSHACQSLDELVKGIQRVQDLREYQDLGVADAIRPLLDFIEEKEDTPSVNFALSNAGIPGAGARQVGAPSRGGFRVAAARELRQNLANFLRYRQGSRSNGLNELILYAHENPEGFDRLLSVLGQSIQRGQVTDFLKLIRRSLPESRD
jgi:hypothetical protein